MKPRGAARKGRTSGWGGARAGAGRPRTPLIELVVEGKFRASRPHHRKLLAEDPSLLEHRLLEEDPNFDTFILLAQIQNAWREAQAKRNPDVCTHLARVFESTARSLNLES
jgi:hypothetical protein